MTSNSIIIIKSPPVHQSIETAAIPQCFFRVKKNEWKKLGKILSNTELETKHKVTHVSGNIFNGSIVDLVEIYHKCEIITDNPSIDVLGFIVFFEDLRFWKLYEKYLQPQDPLLVIKSEEASSESNGHGPQSCVFVMRESEWKILGKQIETIGEVDRDYSGGPYGYVHRYDINKMYQNCKIIDRNPSQEVLDFVSKIEDSEFLDFINEEFEDKPVKKYAVTIDSDSDGVQHFGRTFDSSGDSESDY